MMDQRFIDLAALAANHHGLVDTRDMQRLGITDRMRRYWCTGGLLHQIGPRVYRLAGAPVTWRQQLLAGIRWSPDVPPRDCVRSMASMTVRSNS